MRSAYAERINYSCVMWQKAPLVALALVAWAIAAIGSGSEAQAYYAYVVNKDSSSVSVVDTRTRQALGDSIPAGIWPRAIAITPDGKFAYVSEFEDSISVIDIQKGQVVGSQIAAGEKPGQIAITPDGKRAYVTDAWSEAVSVIDVQTHQRVGEPIAVGASPAALAASPDGQFVYVANFNSTSVSVIRTQIDQVVATIPVGIWPSAIAVTPDGRTLYVANYFSNTVSIIDTHSMQVVGEPVTVGPGPSPNSGPSSIAISPDGSVIYVGNGDSREISVIDTQTNQVIGRPIHVGGRPGAITFSPDGEEAYVTRYSSRSVAVIDTQLRHVVGSINVGETPGDIAVVPAQAPVASFSTPLFHSGMLGALDGSTSVDRDGQVARYDWTFGDGHIAVNAGSTPGHIYSTPGRYSATLTVTDDAGCSTSLVFTGRTAYCNGSPRASQTQEVTVVPSQIHPAIRVRCPFRVKRRVCRFKLRAVGTTRKAHRAQSALARSSVWRGTSALVWLRPKPRFARKFIAAKRILIKGKHWGGGEANVFVRWFRVVRKRTAQAHG